MTVTLRFNGHMGAPKVQEVQVSDPDSLITSIFTNQNLTPPITSESGYIFQGWGSTIDNVESDLTVGQLMSMYHDIPDVVDVYAVYSYQAGNIQLTVDPGGAKWSDRTTNSKVFSIPYGKSLASWHPFVDNESWDTLLTGQFIPPANANHIGGFEATPSDPSYNTWMIEDNSYSFSFKQNTTIKALWYNSGWDEVTVSVSDNGFSGDFTTRPRISLSADRRNLTKFDQLFNRLDVKNLWIERRALNRQNAYGADPVNSNGNGTRVSRITFNESAGEPRRKLKIGDMAGDIWTMRKGNGNSENRVVNSEFFGLSGWTIWKNMDPTTISGLQRPSILVSGWDRTFTGPDYPTSNNPRTLAIRNPYGRTAFETMPISINGNPDIFGKVWIKEFDGKPFKLVLTLYDSKMNRIWTPQLSNGYSDNWQLFSYRYTLSSTESASAKYFTISIMTEDMNSVGAKVEIKMPFAKPLNKNDPTPSANYYVSGHGFLDTPMTIGDYDGLRQIHFDPSISGTRSIQLSTSYTSSSQSYTLKSIGLSGGERSQGSLSDYAVPGLYFGGYLIYNANTGLWPTWYGDGLGDDRVWYWSAGDIKFGFDGGYVNLESITRDPTDYPDDISVITLADNDNTFDPSWIQNVTMHQYTAIGQLFETNNNVLNPQRFVESSVRASKVPYKSWVRIRIVNNGASISEQTRSIGSSVNGFGLDTSWYTNARNKIVPNGYQDIGIWSESKRIFIPNEYLGGNNPNGGWSKWRNSYTLYDNIDDGQIIYIPKPTESTTQIRLSETFGEGLFYKGTVNERKDVTYSVNNTDNWSQAINYAPEIKFNDHKPLYWRNSDGMPLTVQRVDSNTVAEPKWMLEGTVDLYRKPREFFLIDRNTIFDGWLYTDKFNLMDKESVFVLDPTGLGAEYEDQNSNNIDGWAKANQQLVNNDISFKAYYKGYDEYRRLGQWMTGKELVLATLNETGEPTYWMVSKKNIEKTEITEGDDWLVGTITFTKQSPGFDIETLGIGTDSIIDNRDMNPRRNTYVYIKSTQFGTAVKDAYVLATNVDTGEQVMDKLTGTIPVGSFVEYSTIPYNELWAYGSKWGDYPNNLYSNIDPVNSQPIKLGPGRWDVRLSSGDNVTIGSLSRNKILAYQGRTIASLSGKLTNDSMVGVAIKEKEF